MNHTIQQGDARELAKTISNESIDLVFTSPPYWAKRIYTPNDEIGKEETPEIYTDALADFFTTFKHALKSTGNMFIVMGDTWFGSGSGATSDPIQAAKSKEAFTPKKPLLPKIKNNKKLYQPKQMLMIPARFAIAMQDKGWILREDIIWHKPNRIPSGVTDRMINTYEHVFHFVKKPHGYYFNLDAVKIPSAGGTPKNPGDVWSINTQPTHWDHSAMFPEELADRIISCACPPNGTVLDPFLGAGTTLISADRLNRTCTGFEISDKYIEISRQRFKQYKNRNINMFDYF